MLHEQALAFSFRTIHSTSTNVDVRWQGRNKIDTLFSINSDREPNLSHLSSHKFYILHNRLPHTPQCSWPSGFFISKFLWKETIILVINVLASGNWSPRTFECCAFLCKHKYYSLVTTCIHTRLRLSKRMVEPVWTSINLIYWTS